MRRVTFSRNFTLSLSRTCQCFCKYCSFATHKAHLYAPDEVERMLDDAARRGVKELLVLTGEKPEVNPEVAARLREYGHEDFTSYAAWACERGLERGLLPHTHLGALSPPANGDGAAAELRPPDWATPITLDDMRVLVRECRRLMPDVGVQIPPNLSEWWLPLVEDGATDLGGLSANGDHISPEHPFPSVHRMRKALQPRGYALTERLCVYPQYMTPEWMDQSVLDVVKRKYWSFIPRRGSGRREERPIRRELVPGAIAKGRDGGWLDPEELTALFAETRSEAIEDMRQAADELRAELVGDEVTFVVNRNINVSNVCVVGCAFCGFGQGRRSPDAYEHDRDEFVRRVEEAVEAGATAGCTPTGGHPGSALAPHAGRPPLAEPTAPHTPPHPPPPPEAARTSAPPPPPPA